MSFGSSNPPPDPELVQPPTDSISSVRFSPTAHILAVGSWNNEVRLYDVNTQGQSRARAMYSHEGPVLDLCWTPDGSALISAGADKAGRTYDLATGQSRQVAGHDLPIRSIRYSSASNGSAYLMTGGWDKQLRYWDLRTQGMVGAVQLPERCYTMDAQGDVLVVGTAERKIQIYDLRNPGTPVKTIDSPLKWQTRVVSCFPSTAKPGYAVGSIEGRIAYNVLPEQFASETFSFRCHRKEAPGPKSNPPKPTAIFAVNTISFHKGYGTFVSGGGDGQLSFWDAQARARLKTISPQVNLPANATPTPIVATDFNHDCTVLAWAQSYDWSRGHAGATPDMVNRVGLHVVKDEEVKRKAK